MADLIANVLKDSLSYMAFLKDLQAAGYIDASVDVANISAADAIVAVNSWVS